MGPEIYKPVFARFANRDRNFFARIAGKRKVIFGFGIVRNPVFVPVRAKLYPVENRFVSPCPHDRIFPVTEQRKRYPAAFVPIVLIFAGEDVFAGFGKYDLVFNLLQTGVRNADAVCRFEIVFAFLDFVAFHFLNFG